jgi:hypothetical protein
MELPASTSLHTFKNRLLSSQTGRPRFDFLTISNVGVSSSLLLTGVLVRFLVLRALLVETTICFLFRRTYRLAGWNCPIRNWFDRIL